MALSRVTTWSSGQTLTASALNGEFDNILSNALSLISPLSGALDFNGNQLQNLSAGSVSSPGAYFTGDSDTGPYRSAANTYDITTGGVRGLSVTTNTGGTPAASAYLQVIQRNVTEADGVKLATQGTGSNIPLVLAPKGTGYVEIPAGTTPGAAWQPGLAISRSSGDVNDGIGGISTGTLDLIAGGRVVLRASQYASATNYVKMWGGPTSSPATITAWGSDAQPILQLGSPGAIVQMGTAFIPAIFSGAGPAPANAIFAETTVKAWAIFDSTPTISASHGIASVSKPATGIFTVTLSRAMASTPYMVMCMPDRTGASNVSISPGLYGLPAQTTTTTTLSFTNTGQALLDPTQVLVAFLGRH